MKTRIMDDTFFWGVIFDFAVDFLGTTQYFFSLTRSLA